MIFIPIVFLACILAVFVFGLIVNIRSNVKK